MTGLASTPVLAVTADGWDGARRTWVVRPYGQVSYMDMGEAFGGRQWVLPVQDAATGEFGWIRMAGAEFAVADGGAV